MHSQIKAYLLVILVCYCTIILPSLSYSKEKIVCDKFDFRAELINEKPVKIKYQLLDTDLPDSTHVGVFITRTYWRNDNLDAYSFDYYELSTTVSDIKKEKVAVIDETIIQKDLNMRRIEPSKINKISDDLNFKILVPLQGNAEFGKMNENLTGKMVVQSPNLPLKLVEVRKVFRLPVQKAGQTTIVDKLNLDAKVAVEGQSSSKKPFQSSTKPGLGRTDRQILAGLEKYFPHVEKSTVNNGKPRRIWTTTDMITLIEIIGDLQEVEKVNLMFGYPKDAPDTLYIRNALISEIFLKNVLPNWSGGANWMNSAVRRLDYSENTTSEAIQVGNAMICLTYTKNIRTFSLVVERNK
jgi:hypothetical protein